MSEYNINGLAIPLFMVLMLVEYLILRLQGRSLHRFNDSVNSLSMGLLLLLSDALLKAYTFAVFIWLWQNHRLFEFELDNPITWIVFFFGVDFCYYWFHRIAHEINILWGAHVGHHQGEEYNLTTALRQSAFQYAFSWVFYLPLALLGCPPVVFVVQFIVLKMYQFWLHTQAINRIPLIEGIMSTPSSHRVHHAKNPVYIDRNYGGTLVIWDRLFGTWQPELAAAPCHYGTTRPLDTLNPIKANLQHWSMLARDAHTTARWQDKLLLWFRPTGWRPSDCLEKDATDPGMQKNGTADRPKYNPQTTRGKKLYVVFSMAVTFVVCTLFIFLSPQLSAWQLATGVLLVISGLVVASDLLESHHRYRWGEALRMPLMLWFTVHLWTFPVTTQIVDSITIEHPASQSLDYARSVSRWPEWHPQSAEITANSVGPLQAGDHFSEVIDTPIGRSRMSWEVTESAEGDYWRVRGINLDNDVEIELTYRVKTLGEGSSEFERTLQYTMPNFPLVLANAVHFKGAIEQKSEQALERLKAAIERLPPPQ
ncbi:sterol desaturase/SRPBCC family protein [Marinobacter zhejiangensis]|uniref:Sterol desaturase/sphingolipid hydroxylase, fatty acid hydroxylase superfamily n=1 Tax=Marinobacter zhejiangensis TaxID=488535 RepID=A0A1I4PWX4_9GAMM|nr:sterol desaturase family protein [Marinobacter zhejiangensis]SFM32096.1 Sterol desaturase/sphingolipid hydroxylase, fatty acid hydroxylase superfamily [Marinobacter zhejiangensis]